MGIREKPVIETEPFPVAMRIARLAAAFLLSIVAAHAQEVRKVAFRTLCLAPLPELNELQLKPATPKSKPVIVPVFAGSLSQVLEGEFKGDEIVLLPAMIDTNRPMTVAKGTLAKSKRQVFLLKPVKDEKNGDTYQIQAFDDDAADFKLGSVRAINLAPKEIRIKMGGKEMPPLSAGAPAIYPQFKDTDDAGMYPVVVETKSDDGVWTEVYSASWKASDRRREIVVVGYDEASKQMTVKLITDDAPWLQPK